MKLNHPTRRSRRGFSLVELLVVISVIGVMSSIAIPMVTNVNANASVASAKKQAQQIASVFNSGQAAGAFGTPATVSAAMDAVGTGGTGQQGLSGSQFIIPHVSSGMDSGKPADQQVSHYLAVEGGALVYKADGGAPENPNPWERFAMDFPAETPQSTVDSYISNKNSADSQHEYMAQRGSRGDWEVFYRPTA